MPGTRAHADFSRVITNTDMALGYTTWGYTWGYTTWGYTWG
eukprot:CAMPEP_0204328798 /NCGR_PEP_ID=MMETSP0469-20131031/13680_1 /ASSEMBLY_ACC=CAM_ASM_000384 /TAXON_ID=2969 /ORGANISM="Oxyrrhis marina" /LENGTH=40 /DNA_ID= /DNA_START= /DNA_END= /DNA_ORIENTATION=